MKKLIALVLALTFLATPAYASYPPRVERWRGALEATGIDSRGVDLGLHCIQRESGGNPSDRLGQHIGLFQFNNGWGTESQRYNPEWSIRRYAKVYRQSGISGVHKHWCRWHGCGGYVPSGKTTHHREHRSTGRARSKRSPGDTAVPRISNRYLKHVAQFRSTLGYRQSLPYLARLEGRTECYRVAASKADATMAQVAPAAKEGTLK